jgi:hypothetical protein
MRPLTAYRLIAALNGLAGLLMASAVVAVVFPFIRRPEKDIQHLYLAVMVAVMAIIAVGLIWTAVSFLKSPTAKNALALAANTSVIVWAFLARAIDGTNAGSIVGPAHIIIAIVIAYLIYRLLLKPLALRVTPVIPAPTPDHKEG